MPKFHQPAGEVWAEFNLETEYLDPPVVKLLIKPSLRKEAIPKAFSRLDSLKKKDVTELFKESVKRAMDHVMDWDLTDEKDNPIPLDDENRKKCLENLMWEDVLKEKNKKKEKEEKIGFKWLWIEVLKFASDIRNFIKN